MSIPAYTPREIEHKWQQHWDRTQTFRVTEDDDRRKYYLLEMFPYPSGRIHMGHVRNYTIGDVVARYKTMCGCNVLHPMGWDAFGMPAENAAIQSQSHPAVWTESNIEAMKQQLRRLGFSYDWQRELATCDVSYYRWEQWLFLKMYEKGLAYRQKSHVNWCDSCQTVLANEQVENGCCWRCKQEVRQKELYQWFFRITAYAEELLASLDSLTGWPERVVTMQRNWIGRSEGAEIDFTVEGMDQPITVFTTRPDTLYGATFMSLAPEHPLALDLSVAAGRATEVRAFVERVLAQDSTVRSADDLEKEGVFTGAYCLNPATGARMPVYVANFVLMEYGTGAVMAVPAHDQRDFEFARKYGLEAKVVIQPPDVSLDVRSMDAAYVDDGVMVASAQFDGMPNQQAKGAIIDHLADRGVGRRSVHYRLRDWGISRQRYWGAPIPMLHCDTCGIVPVPEDQLPVVLPRDVVLEAVGRSPLAACEAFVDTRCPRCGGAARRETDTMDTFVESSWYFARYASPACDTQMLDGPAVRYWLPVDQYIGGIEHAVLHLLYARFFTKVLRDAGLVPVDEPFANLLTQGMVCKETTRCAQCGWLYPEEVRDGRCVRCDGPVEVGRVEKMSKSTRNVVDPEALIERYGADTARLFCMFAAPPERDLEWSESGVEGAFRFLQRVWRLVAQHRALWPASAPVDWPQVRSEQACALRRKTHQTIHKVTDDIELRFHFNTAISAIMELVNHLHQFDVDADGDPLAPAVCREALETIVLLLSPMVPHICEELWQMMGHTGLVAHAAWPVSDPDIAREPEVEIAVQVNGKVRGRIMVAADADQESVRQTALDCAQLQPWIAGRQIRKVIVVPGKIVSVVVG